MRRIRVAWHLGQRTEVGAGGLLRAFFRLLPRHERGPGRRTQTCELQDESDKGAEEASIHTVHSVEKTAAVSHSARSGRTSSGVGYTRPMVVDSSAGHHGSKSQSLPATTGDHLHITTALPHIYLAKRLPREPAVPAMLRGRYSTSGRLRVARPPSCTSGLSHARPLGTDGGAGDGGQVSSARMRGMLASLRPDRLMNCGGFISTVLLTGWIESLLAGRHVPTRHMCCFLPSPRHPGEEAESRSQLLLLPPPPPARARLQWAAAGAPTTTASFTACDSACSRPPLSPPPHPRLPSIHPSVSASLIHVRVRANVQQPTACRLMGSVCVCIASLLSLCSQTSAARTEKPHGNEPRRRHLIIAVAVLPAKQKGRQVRSREEPRKHGRFLILQFSTAFERTVCCSGLLADTPEPARSRSILLCVVAMFGC